MNLNLCLDAVPGFLGFFDLSIAPALLFYAYLPILVLSIFFGFFIFKKDRGSVLSKYFLGITLSFAAWIFLILFQWVGVYLETVHLAWQLLVLPEISIFLFSILFSYVFIFKKDVPNLYKYIAGLLLSIVAFVLPTQLNIASFDLTNCEGVVGILWPYVYVFELSAIIIIVLIAFEKLILKNKQAGEKLKTVLFSTGMVFFLGIFWLSNYFGELTKTYEINLVGPFGMVLFLGLLTYIIVRFHAFNTKLIATQALVWGLAILIGAEFFFIKTTTNFILTGITFIASMVFGYFLVKSVKKEIQQKEQLAKLNTDLKISIQQRESLVHLINHKVKGSFTRTKFLFAGMLDGTFGEISPEIKKRAEQGLEFDNGGIETVDLVLNVANLQNGLIKYEMKSIDLKELLEKAVTEEKGEADAKGLGLETEIKEGDYTTTGDSIWMKEAMHNLISNSVKYTREGKISVALEKKDGKILFSVKDTGVGITEDDKKNLFTEGGRGKDSIKVNVDSTGYGLYTVKLIVEAHKGKVWAESEGENKGSQFYIELPITP
jgi:signal transduction histidine kinase